MTPKDACDFMNLEAKPLKWVDYDDGTYRAFAHGYDYEVGVENEWGPFHWYEHLTDSFCDDCDSIDSAKAAAQADYERRIFGSIKARPIAKIEAAAFRRGAEQMRAENALLRTSLSQIESGLPAGSTLLHGDAPLWRDAYRELQRIARTALRALPLTEEDKA